MAFSLPFKPFCDCALFGNYGTLLTILQYATESTKDTLKNFLTNQDVLKTSDATRMQWPSDLGGGGLSAK